MPGADCRGRCALAVFGCDRAAGASACTLHASRVVGWAGGAMRRWLPHPLMASFLLLSWLLLQHSLAPGTIVVGLLLALGLTRVLDRLQPPGVRVRHSGVVVGFTAPVFR